MTSSLSFHFERCELGQYIKTRGHGDESESVGSSTGNKAAASRRAPYDPDGSQRARSSLLGLSSQTLRDEQFAGLESQLRQPTPKKKTASHGSNSPDCDGPRSADAIRKDSGKQRSHGSHAHEHHGVHGHSAAPQFIWDHSLNHRVRARHLQHHRVSHRYQQYDE